MGAGSIGLILHFYFNGPEGLYVVGSFGNASEVEFSVRAVHPARRGVAVSRPWAI